MKLEALYRIIDVGADFVDWLGYSGLAQMVLLTAAFTAGMLVGACIA